MEAEIPPALAALATRPHLQTQAGRSAAQQARRIAERTTHFVPRPGAIAALDLAVRSHGGGAVAIPAAPGSGTTALLCRLVLERPWAFWLPEEDGGAGGESLCAQLLALHQLPVPLVPPAAARDALTVERLLDEAGARRPADNPLVVVLGRLPESDLVAAPPPLPAAIPPGVTLLVATQPDAQLAGGWRTLQLPLPTDEALLVAIGQQLGAGRRLSAAVAARSGGRPLYVRLAVGLIGQGLLAARGLPEGLDALHRRWWEGLDDPARRLACVLAAGGPLERGLAVQLAQITPDAGDLLLRSWGPLVERDGAQVRLYHSATRSFVREASGDALAATHAAFVELTMRRAAGRPERAGWEGERSLARGLARHLTLSGAAAGAPDVTSRAWVMAQERRAGSMRGAAGDAAWALRAACDGESTLALVRTAALSGALALLARSLPPRAAAETFAAALDAGQPRDATLRRIRAMVDQLPDGPDKALTLRQLGEVCYAVRMRAAAMRMLSEALDLEAPGPTRAWRDEREEVLVALARGAVAAGEPDIALGITTRIAHAERRGMIETEVVRWLLARGQRTRAEEVAYAIGHAGNHEWAMAEVAVGHARAGDFGRADVVLGTLRTETAVAWVSAELACDAARRGNPRAADRVAMLPNATLRDRALAQVARALITQVAPDTALEVARMIDDHESRARCLIDMALEHPPIADVALDEAATAATAVEGEERVSVLAALAAAEAASGRAEIGMRMAALLPEGEERSRAHSRIVVGLARRGDHAAAEAVAASIDDADERDWSLDELARSLAATGAYREAFALAAQIGAAEQRARSEADLAIAWARGGEPVAAHARAEQITLPAERARAQAAICVPLVASGARARAFVAVAAFMPVDAASRYLAAAAAALAAAAAVDDAVEVALAAGRALDRARALVAVSRAAARAGDRGRAHRLLGAALRSAAPLGRAETLQCVGWAADALAAIGGPELLLACAAAINDLDGWWR